MPTARTLAWSLQVDLATRVGTQPLLAHEGQPAEALASLRALAQAAQAARACPEDSADGARLRDQADRLRQLLEPFLERWDDRRGQEDAFRDALASLAVPLTEITQGLSEITDTDLAPDPPL